MYAGRKTMLVSFLIATAVILVGSPLVLSHCEIPCGIYDDHTRIAMIAEHITTIEKSMNQIAQLSAEKDKNYNQLVRWIINKENHADQLSDVVTQYFMKQRITPVEKGQKEAYESYVQKITLLHAMMVHAMKCKQTTDIEHVSRLRTCLADFETAYLGADHERM